MCCSRHLGRAGPNGAISGSRSSGSSPGAGVGYFSIVLLMGWLEVSRLMCRAPPARLPPSREWKNPISLPTWGIKTTRRDFRSLGGASVAAVPAPEGLP